MLNKVELIGRLGQDPKLIYLPSGSPVMEFSLATGESYKDKEGNKIEQTEWHRVKVFGKAAEFLAGHLAKGRLVYVAGTLRTRNWDKDGQKHYITEVVLFNNAHVVKFLDKKPEEPAAQQRQQAQPSEQDLGPAFPSEAGGMDDVPF